MTYKDKQKYNDYLNQYMKKRYEKRRKEAIILLGGKCVECSSDEELEFDHINPNSKIKSIARFSSASEKIFKEEIAKCQLLCRDCHLIKTQKEQRHKWICLGVSYDTCRDMMNKTSLPINTILKYRNKEGVFDVDAYRKSCYRVNLVPKV